MDLVLRRLDKLGETELHILWREVLAERGDPNQSASRRLEARLGYDPDEAPPALVDQFLRLADTAGSGTPDELAPVCAGSNPGQQLSLVESFAAQPGIPGVIALSAPPSGQSGSLPPWQRARLLAAHVRESLGLRLERLTDKVLADVLHISPEAFTPSPASVASPVGLAVRSDSNGAIKLLFRKRNRPARRFEAARFVADFLSHSDSWLAVADTATARQTVQRAFAAEFLCPIESLRAYLGDNFVPEALEDASDHFGISEMAVESHLTNHGLIPPAMGYFPA